MICDFLGPVEGPLEWLKRRKKDGQDRRKPGEQESYGARGSQGDRAGIVLVHNEERC